MSVVGIISLTSADFLTLINHTTLFPKYSKTTPVAKRQAFHALFQFTTGRKRKQFVRGGHGAVKTAANNVSSQ